LIDNALLSRAAITLRERSTAVETLLVGGLVSRNLTFDKIRGGFRRGEIASWLRQNLGENINNPVIYRITATDLASATILYNAFGELADDRGYKIPQNNQVQDSTTVYVGRSNDIKKRMREHLQQAAPATYALNMGRWCPAGAETVCIEFIAILGNPESTIIQDVEDELWRQSRPMFGKLGSK